MSGKTLYGKIWAAHLVGQNAATGEALGVGERGASTENRNVEGREGRGGRTHLMSPVRAARAAANGVIG